MGFMSARNEAQGADKPTATDEQKVAQPVDGTGSEEKPDDKGVLHISPVMNPEYRVSVSEHSVSIMQPNGLIVSSHVIPIGTKVIEMELSGNFLEIKDGKKLGDKSPKDGDKKAEKRTINIQNNGDNPSVINLTAAFDTNVVVKSGKVSIQLPIEALKELKQIIAESDKTPLRTFSSDKKTLA